MCRRNTELPESAQASWKKGVAVVLGSSFQELHGSSAPELTQVRIRTAPDFRSSYRINPAKCFPIP